MRRREFIAGLGGAATWPLVGRGQQAGAGVRRIGWLVDRDESDPQARAWGGWLREELRRLGWVEGQNLRIDIRFGTRDRSRIRDLAMELVKLAPEAILTNGGVAIDERRQQTQTIPIVFTAGPNSEVRTQGGRKAMSLACPLSSPRSPENGLSFSRKPHLTSPGLVLSSPPFLNRLGS